MSGLISRLTALLAAVVLASCTGEADTTTPLAADSNSRSAVTTTTPIERLYAQPSIVGTTPEGVVWSPDGDQLAFLWNDEGRTFREVWVHTVADGTNRRMTQLAGEQPLLSEHPGISEVVWLGDGDRLGYVVDGAAYLLDANGESAPLTIATPASKLSFSTANDHLAFLANGSLWVKDIRSGTNARELVDPGSGRVFVERYEWSADGRQIAFVQTDNRAVREIAIYFDSAGETHTHRVTRAFPGDETPKRRVGVVDVGSGEVQWYERPDEQDPIWGFGLSSNGERLFVDHSDFLIKERTILVFDVATATSEVFFRTSDPQKVMPGWSAAWAPGDEGLIVLSDHEGWFHLYHQRTANGLPQPLTSGNWEIDSFEVDAKNSRLWFLANKAHRAELQLYRVPVAGGEIEQVSRQPGTHEVAFTPDFRRIADRFSNDTTPPDLYISDLSSGDGAFTRITKSPSPGFDELSLADVSYVEFESHVDGTPLLGRLSLPREFDPQRRYPLLMGSIYPNSVRNRWGAGNAIPTWGLDQHLVERGYILMKVDVRGSWGHGKDIRQDLFRDYGGIDKDDVESGVRHLVAAGMADPDRVGIWGWSYGGLMTLMSLFHKPDVYAVGIADAPATNVAHAFPEQMWVMGRPEGADYPERYERMSALYHSAGLAKPLMITHATRDDVVLYSDTIALAERMIAGGKTFELVTMPGSSHVWARDSRDQLFFGYRKMVEFFDRHLQP